MAARGILCLGVLRRHVPAPFPCDPRRQQWPSWGSCRGRRNNPRPRKSHLACGERLTTVTPIVATYPREVVRLTGAL